MASSWFILYSNFAENEKNQYTPVQINSTKNNYFLLVIIWKRFPRFQINKRSADQRVFKRIFDFFAKQN